MVPAAMRLIGWLLLIAFGICFGPAAASAHETHHVCDAAAANAERDWNVPAGVLSAVGTVESGRHGRFGAAPWPWTINAAGRGFYFESKAAAIEAVLGLMQRGYPFVDVGCFQIDIAYHPDVFRSLDEAFDPERNAQAAARLLLTERARAPDWATAVAHYHSATPSLGGPYLQRVRAALPTARIRGQNAQFLLDWERGDSASPSNADAALPKVIYPEPPPRAGCEPQIVFLGGAAVLPRVVVQGIGSPNAHR